jgi:hypothetical protein
MGLPSRVLHRRPSRDCRNDCISKCYPSVLSSSRVRRRRHAAAARRGKGRGGAHARRRQWPDRRHLDNLREPVLRDVLYRVPLGPRRGPSLGRRLPHARGSAGELGYSSMRRQRCRSCRLRWMAAAEAVSDRRWTSPKRRRTSSNRCVVRRGRSLSATRPASSCAAPLGTSPTSTRATARVRTIDYRSRTVASFEPSAAIIASLTLVACLDERRPAARLGPARSDLLTGRI